MADYPTPGDDRIVGTDGPDRIDALAGHDTVDAWGGDDTLYGDAGNDILGGWAGDDLLHGEDGSDFLFGGFGADWMRGGAGDDDYVVDSAGDVVVEAAGGGVDAVHSTVSHALAAEVENLFLSQQVTARIDGIGNALDNFIVGNEGANHLSGGAGNDHLRGWGGDDTLEGGAGDDLYDIFDAGSAGDAVVEAAGGGRDTVRSEVDYALAAEVEDLVLDGGTAGTGNSLDNWIRGSAGANHLSGGAGDDQLEGGDGDDRILGEAGVDRMGGGAGADRFVFGSAADASGDRIFDFRQSDGDRIDVSAIATTTFSKWWLPNFTWKGTDAFTGPGQLRYFQAGGETHVEGNTGGDLQPEFTITLNGSVPLSGYDFVVRPGWRPPVDRSGDPLPGDPLPGDPLPGDPAAWGGW